MAHFDTSVKESGEENQASIYNLIKYDLSEADELEADDYHMVCYCFSGF